MQNKRADVRPKSKNDSANMLSNCCSNNKKIVTAITLTCKNTLRHT